MRAALLALLLLVAPANAAPDIRPAPEFKVQLAAAVFSTAFGFIQSRSVEVATVEQIALWGLRAVTALDPGLEVERRDGILVDARIAALDDGLLLRARDAGSRLAELGQSDADPFVSNSVILRLG